MQPSQPSKMDERTSMPPRGRKPGFKIGRHNLPYWIARQVCRDPMGFADTCIALPAELPPEAEDPDLETFQARLCHEHTARLRAHIAAVQAGAEASPTKTKYNGTMLSACRIYQEHPFSRFNKVSHTTREGYVKHLKLIEATVGARVIRNVTVLTVQDWYDNWRKPAKGSSEERIERAHKAAAMVRTVVYFMAALRNDDCKVLASELEKVKFERAGAREQELTYQHVKAFTRTARDLGERGVIPRDRALYMSIAVTASFELLLRNKDVIGGYEPTRAERRYPKGVGILHVGDEEKQETWSGFFTWENIPGWIWRMKTSKSKYRAAAEFDLSIYDLLYPLLEQVPHDQRHGSIVKGEHGLPMRYRSCAKWFRQIADIAGIPSDVKKMDARAGGMTEADDAGAELEDISAAGTHTNLITTRRYLRRRNKKIRKVASARKQLRAGDDGGTA